MTTQSPQPAKRFRKLYVLWGLALALLICAALFSWKVAVPALEVKGVVEDFEGHKVMAGRDIFYPDSGPFIVRLGGKHRASQRLALYLRLPGWAAPHRYAALDLLGDCEEAAVPALTELALGDRNDGMRGEAIKRLVWSGPGRERAVPALIRLFDDENERVSFRAAQALAAMGDAAAGAVPALSRALGSDRAKKRRWAAMALGGIGPSAGETVPALTGLLGDADKWVRLVASESLGDIRDPRAIQPLERLLSEEPEADVREAAAAALKQIREAQGGDEKK